MRTLTSRTAFVLTPAARICRVRALKESKYQLPFVIYVVQDVNVLVYTRPFRIFFLDEEGAAAHDTYFNINKGKQIMVNGFGLRKSVTVKAR